VLGEDTDLRPFPLKRSIDSYFGIRRGDDQIVVGRLQIRNPGPPSPAFPPIPGVALRLHLLETGRRASVRFIEAGGFHALDLAVRFLRVIMATCKSISKVLVVAVVLCLCSAPAWSQPEDDRRQMQGLDEQIQEVKSEVLSIAEELNRLEEKLLYPSGTQVAIFIALAEGESMRLDAVRLHIDGQLVTHHLYSAKELEALRKGGVQRVYVGNVSTGTHRLEVVVDGKTVGGDDFRSTEDFEIRKEVKPKLVGLTLASPNSGAGPVTLGDW